MYTTEKYITTINQEVIFRKQMPNGRVPIHQNIPKCNKFNGKRHNMVNDFKYCQSQLCTLNK